MPLVEINKSDILVSVITVAYNSEKTISETIQSVLNQTYRRIEYIIVDGLSTDQTVKIARSYKKKFAERGYDYLIISEKDQGIYDAMNKGICLSKGKIVGIINSDDWYELNAIEEMVNVYQREPFDVFYADIKIHKSGKVIIKSAKCRNLLTTRDWNHPTTFITKAVYEEYQYENKTLYDDWDLILKLHRAGKKFSILNKTLANFRFGGISNKKSIKRASKRCLIRYQIYRKNGYSFAYIFECLLVEIIKWVIA